jgi:uncharacterized protein (TIGR00299 family) protein
MLLGAFVDLGLSLDVLRAELAKLPLRGYAIEARRVERSGVQATKVDVVVSDHDHHDEHERDHPHGSRAHAHPPRGLREVVEILQKSALAPGVRERAVSLFRRLAEAEAAVHGIPPEEVHFHEVGAVDAIVDVVGAVCGFAWIGADRVVSSPLNVGTGTVTMSHGTFSVPAPATARLVAGVPVYGDGEGERLTPTGALLVTGYADAYGALPLLRISGIGYGAGSRDAPDRPNVLRIIVGETGADRGASVLVLECEVDDMAPQLLGPLVDRLLGQEGVLDVYYTPVQMKKGRPGILITVLADPGAGERAEETLFRETTTLGVRRLEWDRTELERESVPVSTAYGEVRVKLGRRGGTTYNAQPEFEDCRRLAEAHGVPVKEVWAAALSAHRSGR